MEAFRQAIADAGINPPEHVIADGLIHSFSTNGKASDKAGRYCLFDDDFPAGWFKDWRTGIEENWHDNSKKLSEPERQQQRKRMDAIKEKRKEDTEQLRDDGMQKAQKIYNECDPVTSHPYLTKKGVQAYRGVRQKRGQLVIPVRNADGELQSLQYINEGKLYLKGASMSGGYFSIGDVGDVLCIAEGYATGASIHEATGHAVAIAFDSNNLINVANVMRGKFPDKRIIICADDDYKNIVNVGLKKARQAAKEIHAEIVVPDFGDNRPDDATDFNDLHSLEGLDVVKAAFAEEYQGGLLIQPLMEVIEKPVEWLWKGHIAIGKLNIFGGNAGLNKSTLTLAIAATISTGGTWADGTYCPQGDVIIMSSEDDVGDTIKPRLRLAGADMSRVHNLSFVNEPDGTGTFVKVAFSFLRHLYLLELHLRKNPHIKLIVVDPIAAFCGGIKNAFDATEVRSALAPMIDLLSEHGVAMLALMHLNKAEGMSALNRFSGSGAWTQVARSVWFIDRDHDSAMRRVLLPVKNNLARDDVGNSFDIEIVDNHPVVMWLPEPVRMTADQYLGLAKRIKTEKKIDFAINWLKDLLSHGKKPHTEVLLEAENKSITSATLRRAKSELGVESSKTGFGGNSTTFWLLPKGTFSPNDAQDPLPTNMSAIGEITANDDGTVANDVQNSEKVNPIDRNPINIGFKGGKDSNDAQICGSTETPKNDPLSNDAQIYFDEGEI